MIFRPISATSAEKYDNENATIGKRKLHPHRGNGCRCDGRTRNNIRRNGSDCRRCQSRRYVMQISHNLITNLYTNIY